MLTFIRTRARAANLPSTIDLAGQKSLAKSFQDTILGYIKIAAGSLTSYALAAKKARDGNVKGAVVTGTVSSAFTAYSVKSAVSEAKGAEDGASALGAA